MRRNLLQLGLCAALVALAPVQPSAARDWLSPVGAVYTMTNATAGNEVVVFDRMVDGSLRRAASVRTDGAGTGAGLGNQSAIVLSRGERHLFVVNAASNDISAFSVKRKGLKLVDRASSQGTRPVSLALDGNLLYVLNAGSDSIAGFHVDDDGTLTPLSGSIRKLSATGTGPAQIAFAAGGRVLVVTEKATGKLTSFRVNRWGLPGEMKVFDSVAPTPFGFAVTHQGDIVVSQAAGGAKQASVVTSYNVGGAGGLEPVTSIATGQTAVCWVAIAPDGEFAYATNTGSGTLTAFRVDDDGVLSLLNGSAVAASTGTGSAPIDLAFSRNGRFLYVLNSGVGTISAFRVRPDGSLLELPGADALPPGTNGLAAR